MDFQIQEVICIKMPDPTLPGRMYLDSNGKLVRSIEAAHRVSPEERKEILSVLPSSYKNVSFVEVQSAPVL